MSCLHNTIWLCEQAISNRSEPWACDPAAVVFIKNAISWSTITISESNHTTLPGSKHAFFVAPLKSGFPFACSFHDWYFALHFTSSVKESTVSSYCCLSSTAHLPLLNRANLEINIGLLALKVESPVIGLFWQNKIY